MPDARTTGGRALGASLVAVVLTCAGALATDAVPGAAASTACAGVNVHPNATNMLTADAATLCLVNRMRRTRRLRPLRANHELGRVARSQVTTMVDRDYFSDLRPTGQTPLSLVAVTRYPAHAAEFSVGQNIAWGTGNFTTPAHIVAEWMASPPHREIMLSGVYRDAGVAVTPAVPTILSSSGAGATYAIEFGVRRF
ncbi:MAG: CAP domain-containing protein [Solirubrobacteraceae bacterium]